MAGDFHFFLEDQVATWLLVGPGTRVDLRLDSIHMLLYTFLVRSPSEKSSM